MERDETTTALWRQIEAMAIASSGSLDRRLGSLAALVLAFGCRMRSGSPAPLEWRLRKGRRDVPPRDPQD